MPIKKQQKPQNKKFFKMTVSDFPKKFIFTQKFKKLKFLYHFLQNPNFSKFSKKNVQYVVEPCLDIWHAQLQADMSTFAKHITQKPYPLMTPFFSNCDFENL